MTAVRTICLLATAGLLVALSVSSGQAQLREQPELLKRIWPLFRAHRPVVLMPEPIESPPIDQPDSPEPKRKRPLVAPFMRGKININTCTLAQLQALPGVSASLGARILAGRPYRNFDDLERNGVPLNVVAQLRNNVTFGPRP